MNDIARAQDAIKAGVPWRLDQRAKNEPWIGRPIAEAFGIDLGTKANWSRHHHRQQRLASGFLSMDERPDKKGTLAATLGRPPLRGNYELVIDETGVGRPVGDLFDDAGMQPTRVTITAGENQSGFTSGRRWHVAKSLLISNLDARLHTGELCFAASLTEAGALHEELKDFRRKVSAAGRYSFEARVGKHDDLVLAVAIGLWAFVGRPKPAYASFG